jgi:hypothetical protein
VQRIKKASQTRPSVAWARSGQAPWIGAARQDPSVRKERLLGMTTERGWMSG